MPMTLNLTSEEVEGLRQVAYRSCVVSDVEFAFKRCLSRAVWEDCYVVGEPINELTVRAIKRIGAEGDGGYPARSLILRLIEQKWNEQAVRRGAVGAVPTIIRAPRGFESQLASLDAALTSLISKLPEAPTFGNVGPVFKSFCDARRQIADMVVSLRRLDALKAAHDSLHVMQIFGAEQLDTFPSGHTARDTAEFLALLSRVQTAMAVAGPHLPVAATELFGRCLSASRDAERRLLSGDEDEIALACATIRALLIWELPLIDNLMFETSRDLPVREFCACFESETDDPVLVAARDACLDVADTLRRRLMEHGFWQAADSQIYVLEQKLAQPSATPFADFGTPMLTLLSDLRHLLGDPLANAVVSPMHAAMLRYLSAMDGKPPAGADVGTFEEVQSAFADMRKRARSAFLNVDQALLHDLSRLSTLKTPLETILDRIPEYCAFLLPT